MARVGDLNVGRVNEFKQAKDAIVALRKAEAEEELDWEPKPLRKFHRRRKAREVLLEHRCPTRVCKFCLRTKTRSRQWVIVSDTQALVSTAADLKLLTQAGVICRACYQSKFRRKTVFKLTQKRFQLDNDDLRLKRRRAHVTQKRFAEMCGWSPTYQWKLEHEIEFISEETKNVIESVFKELK